MLNDFIWSNYCLQVYETVESMLLNQDEFLKNTIQPEEIAAESTAAGDQLSNRFKRLSLIFGGRSKTSPGATTKDSKNTEESPGRQPFSLFSKKPPKPSASPSDKPPSSVENDWTMV